MASREDLEDDILFQNVLIESLDEGADDYGEKLAGLKAIKQNLEQQLAALETAHTPTGLDGARDEMPSDAFDGQLPDLSAYGQPDTNLDSTYPGSATFPNGQAGGSTSNGMKRSRQHSSVLAEHEHPAKRPTPEHSSGSTPSSSSSFEFVDHPDRVGTDQVSIDRARRRQLQHEAAIRRRTEEQRADAELARRLSQAPSHDPRPFAGPSSSQRSGLQTTLGHNGSYSRPSPMAGSNLAYVPPPSSQQARQSIFGQPSLNVTPSQHTDRSVKPEPSWQSARPVKPEPSPSSARGFGSVPQFNSQQQSQRARERPPIVDLTGDASDDEPSEIAPSTFTPSRRSNVPAPTRSLYGPPYGQVQYPPGYPRTQYNPYQSMPGAFPADPVSFKGQPAYGSPNPVTFKPELQNQVYGYPSNPAASAYMPRPPPAMSSTPRGLGNPLAELGRLVPGSSSRPYSLYEDDDDDEGLEYTGSRTAGSHAYAGFEEMYRRRFDQIQEHDPAKTQEEISNLLNNIRPDEDVPDELLVPTPEAMTIRLHKYQEAGLTWLQKCEEGTNKGGILADDMGLGKTIQMLSLLVTRKSEDPRCKTTLIVAPVALLRQWRQEIQQKIKTGRHALTVFTYHGASKKKNFRDLQHYDVVITTYGSLASEVKKLEKYTFRKKNDPDARPTEAERCAIIDPDAFWYRIILDEAQCIKNRSTQTAKGACMVNAKYRFCMTGTPMMNNITELYSLIHFLRIKPYCSWEKFRFDFVTPLKTELEDQRKKAMKMLQTLCRAIMLRRTKKSMHRGKPILTLPERTTEKVHSVFNKDEHELYQALETKTAVQFNKYLKAGTVGRSYTAILVLLLRMRQACCHPHLIKDFSVSEAAGVGIEDMVKLAEQLEPQVVARIKESQGNFECPICMDGCTNPAIFLPCGHDTCRDCFVTLSDPANHIAQGNENGASIRCPECRGDIDTKRITDFQSFRKVHMRETLSKDELEALEGEESGSASGDSDSETESEDEMEDETLDGFIVKDEDEIERADSTTESQSEEVKPEAKVKAEDGDDTADYDASGVASPPKSKGKQPMKDKKAKKSKKSKKGKGKEKANQLSLADLKKLSTRNAGAKKKYLKRLRKSFVSSAKIDKMMDILEEVVEAADDGEKVLIFSQWTSLLDLAEVPIEGKGWGYRRYDGSMNAKMRGDAVDDFKDTRKNVRIMLVSLKAGNAGLNLNIASRVIILDPFWNPYVEEQAIDRAHRIGQVRPVKVHRVLVEATVEDRIIELQDKKRALIEEALDEKEHQNISRLGVQELAYLFGVTRSATDRVQYQERRRGQ
jgi:SNF2 family DNA or RNA helicase